jgi:alpha/beta superfamily hydrolase
MNASTRTQLIAGPAGPIDVAVDLPNGPVQGVALVAHPHPLYGGTRDNKVVQTLARAMLATGYAVWRPNFRGVGATAGEHDHGQGETDDLATVLASAIADPLVPEAARGRLAFAGFSFGSFVLSRLLARLPAAQRSSAPIILVGVAAQRFAVEDVPPGALVIHGEVDDVVPLAAVLNWARPQNLPVVVLPGADHFFHRRLTQLKQLVVAHLLAAPLLASVPGLDLAERSAD